MNADADSRRRRPTQLAQALAITPRLELHLDAMDLDLALWPQRDRYYEIPELADPVISLHVGGPGRVRFGEGTGWSRRSSTIGTVTFLPPGLATRWLVEGGEVEHLSITTGPSSPLRTVVTGAIDCIEVGMPDPLNVNLGQTLVEALDPDDPTEKSDPMFINSLCETLLRNFARLHRIRYSSTGLDTESTCPVSSRAIRAIEARFAEPLKVSELAEQAGLSAAHFNEVFKKGTGLTPHQYILRVRVERVSAVLKEHDTPLAEIAHNFGFSSQSHLNTAFRKITGVTPKQYRRQSRANRAAQ